MAARGILVAAALGVAHIALYSWLAADGHQPTMTRGLLLPAEEYYAYAAFFAGPLTIALCMLVAIVAHLGARGASPVPLSYRHAVHAFGLAYSVPLLMAYVLPELLVYGLSGFEALGPAMRVYAPIAVLWVFVLVVWGLRAVYGASTIRSITTALAAAVAQGIPAALLLR
jgi:hypothetical protein